MFFENSFTDL